MEASDHQNPAGHSDPLSIRERDGVRVSPSEVSTSPAGGGGEQGWAPPSNALPAPAHSSDSESDTPVFASLPEGQSAFDESQEPLDSQAQELPDLDGPAHELQYEPLDEPAPLIASSMPLDAEPSIQLEPAPLVAQSIDPVSMETEPPQALAASIYPITQPEASIQWEPAPVLAVSLDPIAEPEPTAQPAFQLAADTLAQAEPSAESHPAPAIAGSSDPLTQPEASIQLEPAPIAAVSLDPIAQGEPSAEPVSKPVAQPEPIIAQQTLSPLAQVEALAQANQPATPAPDPEPAVAAVAEPTAAEPEPQPFFPTIKPEKPAQPTLAEKLALLKASLPSYPSPIQSPVKPIASLAAGFISPEPPAPLPTPTPEAQAPAPAPAAPAPAPEPQPVLPQEPAQAAEPIVAQEPVIAQAAFFPQAPVFTPAFHEESVAQAPSQPLPEPGADALAEAIAESVDQPEPQPATQTIDQSTSQPIAPSAQDSADDADEETIDGNTLFELKPGDPDTEESGIYATAASQASQDLQACAASPVLALTRDVDNVPIEDAGHLRLPQSPALKFAGAPDEPGPAFASQYEPPAPMPLVVSAVAAAGGTALALGMQGPDDQPAQPVSKKSPSKKTRKNWWFIPSTSDTPQSKQSKRIDRFAAVCAVGVLGLMGVLAARVVQLQLKPEPRIAALVDSQNSKATLHYRRGIIEDRNGRALSLTRATKSVFVDPGIVQDAKSFSQDIGAALKLDPANLQSKIENAGDRRYIKIVRKANEDQVDILPTFKGQKEFKPLGTETVLVRDYPYKNLAAHLLGFVNIDGKGIEGVERLFNAQLTGQNGNFTYERDSRHRSLWINDGEYQLPQDGQPVRLSIDITIQRIAEKELADSCSHFQAKSGAVIVMDPKTGEILALAVYPEIDANAFGKAAPELRKNHAITDIYEPGSTFKPFVWAVATEGGYARPMEMLDCGPGVWRSSTGRTLHDAHPVGRATWDEVLVKSSNIGMAIVGERMGAQALYNSVSAFGFGKPTGSGLPGEIGGILHKVQKWTSYSVTSIPMGQEISVTPIQMARAYCALANGGTLVTPTIKFIDPDSQEAQSPQGPRVLKPETAVHTRNVMRRVVLEGTGKQANSKLYSIFGKTGTAQMANPKGGGYEPDAYTGSFACGAPVEDPRIVVVTILQRPKRSIGYYGGTIAAPAGMRIVEQTLAYLGVTPDVPQEQPPKTKTPASSSRILQVNNRAPGR
jgi:cell division protein FtsI (penicillin-binding protein 3)